MKPLKNRRFFFSFRSIAQNQNHKPCRLLRFFLKLFAFPFNWHCDRHTGWMDKQLPATPHINYSHFQKREINFTARTRVRNAKDRSKRTSQVTQSRKCSSMWAIQTHYKFQFKINVHCANGEWFVQIANHFSVFYRLFSTNVFFVLLVLNIGKLEIVIAL